MAQVQRSAAAQHLDALGAELRLSQARTDIFPHIVELRRRNAHSKRNVKDDVDEGSISKKELQQLACFWRLNRMPGFWTKNSTFDTLISTLAKRLREDEDMVCLAASVVSHSDPVGNRCTTPSAAQRAKTAEGDSARENITEGSGVHGLGESMAMTRSSSAAAGQAARLPAAAAGDTSGFMHTPRAPAAQDEHANEAWRTQLGSLLSPFRPSGQGPVKGSNAGASSMRSPGMLVYASRLAPGSTSRPLGHTGASASAFGTVAGGSPGGPSSLHPDAVAGFASDGSPGAQGGTGGLSEAERQAVAKGDQAFQSLRLSSTATLVQLVQQPEMRPRIADSNAPRTLFATWRTVMAEAAAASDVAAGGKRRTISSDASAIRHNAAVVLCYTFLSEHMPHDDMLLPVMSLCAAGMDAASAVATSAVVPGTALSPSRGGLPDVFESHGSANLQEPVLMTPEQLRTAAVCVLARRLLQPAETRPLDVLYIPGMIAAITAVARHKATEAGTLRVCAVALHRMLVVCQEQEQQGDEDDAPVGAPGTTSSRSTNTEGVSQTDRARLVSRIAAGSVSGNDSFRVGSGHTPSGGNSQWGSRRRRRRDANAAVKVAVQNGIVPLLIRLIDMSTSGRLARAKAAVVRRAMATRGALAKQEHKDERKQEHKGDDNDDRNSSSSDSNSVSSIGEGGLPLGVSPAVGPGGRVPALVGGAFENHASLSSAEIAALTPEERALLRDCASIQASCSSALAEIASVPSSVKSLGASRLLPALVALLSEHDVLPGTQDIAAGVLFRLTLGDDVLAREVLALPDAVRAIVAASCTRAQFVAQHCKSLATWPDNDKQGDAAPASASGTDELALRSRRSQAVAELSVDVAAAQSNAGANLEDVLAEVQLSSIDGVSGVRLPQQTEEPPAGQSHLVHFASQSSRTLLHLAKHAPLVPTLIAEGAGDALRIWFEVGLTDIKTVAMNALATLFELSSAGSQRHLLRLGFVRTLVDTVHEFAAQAAEAHTAATAEKEKAAALQRATASQNRSSFSVRAGSASSLRGALSPPKGGQHGARGARGPQRRGMGVRGGSRAPAPSVTPAAGLPIGRCAKALRSLCAGSRDTALHVLEHGAVSALAKLLKHGDATARFDALQSLLSLTEHPQGVAAMAAPPAAAPKGRAAGEGEDWGLDGAVQVEDEEDEEGKSDGRGEYDPLALLLHCARPTAPYKDVEPAVRTLSSICRSPAARTRLVAITGGALLLPPGVVDRLWAGISDFIASARPQTPSSAAGGMRRTPSFATTGGVHVPLREELSRDDALQQLREESVPEEQSEAQGRGPKSETQGRGGGAAAAASGGGAAPESDASAAESLRQRTESALRSGIMPSNNMHNLSRLMSPTDYSRSAIQAFGGGRGAVAAIEEDDLRQMSLKNGPTHSVRADSGLSPKAGGGRQQASPAAYRRPASPEVADSPEPGEQQVMSHVSTTIAGGTSPTPLVPTGAAPPHLGRALTRGAERELTNASDASGLEGSIAVPVGRKRRKESVNELPAAADAAPEESWVEQARTWWAEHRFEGAIETLSRVARSRPLLKGVCISALCQLSAVPSCHAELIRHGVLPMLAAHARAVDSALRRECAQAAFNLTCTSEAQATPEHSAEVAAVERLLQQLERRGDAMLLKHAEVLTGAATVASPTDASDTSRSSGSRGGRGAKPSAASSAKERSAVALARIFPTHSALATHLAELAGQAAADSRSSAALHFATRETQMVSSQIGSAMTVGALFRSDDWHTKHLTTAALFNLAVDPAARPYLLQGGMLWATVKLAVEAEAATQLTLASSIENCALRARLLPSGYLPPDVNKRGQGGVEEEDLQISGAEASDSGAPMWSLRSWEEASALMVAKHQQEQGGGRHVRTSTLRRRRPRGLPRRTGGMPARGSARAALGSDKGSSAANLLGNAGEGPMFYLVLCAEEELPWPGVDGCQRGQQHFGHLTEGLPDVQELSITRGGDPSLGILGDVTYEAEDGEDLNAEVFLGVPVQEGRSVSQAQDAPSRPGSAGSNGSAREHTRGQASRPDTSHADASGRTGTSHGAQQGGAAGSKHAHTDLCITPHTQAARFAAAGFEFACRGAGVLHAASKVVTGDEAKDADGGGDVGLPDGEQAVRYDGASNCAAIILKAPVMGDAASQLTASALLANLVADATVGALLLGTLHAEALSDSEETVLVPSGDLDIAAKGVKGGDGSDDEAAEEGARDGGRPPKAPGASPAAEAKMAAAAATATQAFLPVLGDRRTLDALTTLASAVHPQVRGNVARTLLGLTQHTGLHLSLVRKGVLPALSECVANADLAGLTRCCVALARLLSSPAARDSVAASPLTAVHLFVGIVSRLRQLCSITRVPSWQAEGKVTPAALLARAQVALSLALHSMACAPLDSMPGLLAAGWLRVLLAGGLLLCQTQPTPMRGAGTALRSAASIPINDSNSWIMQTLPGAASSASVAESATGLCLDTWAVVSHGMSAALQHSFMQPGGAVCSALGASPALTQQLFFVSFTFLLGGRVPSILSSYSPASHTEARGGSSPESASEAPPPAVHTPPHWFVVGGDGSDAGAHPLHAAVQPCKLAVLRDALPRVLQAWSAVAADFTVSQHLLKPAILSTLAAVMLPDHPCDCLLQDSPPAPSASARTDTSTAAEGAAVARFAGIPSAYWGAVPVSVSAAQCSLAQSASSGLGKVLAPVGAAYVNCEVHADLNPLLQLGGNGLLVDDAPLGATSTANVVPVSLLWAPTLATRVLCALLKTQSTSIVHGAVVPAGVFACLMHSWQLSSEHWTGVGPWLASKLPSGQETGSASATTPTPKKQPLSALPAELGRFVTAAARTCVLDCLRQLSTDASALGGGAVETPAEAASPMMRGTAHSGDATALLAVMAAAGLLEAACGTLQRIPEARRQLQGAYARLLALRNDDVEWTTTATGEWVQLGASEMGAGEDVVNTVGGNATQPPAAQLKLAKALVQGHGRAPGDLSSGGVRGGVGSMATPAAFVTCASHVLPLALRKCFSAKSSAMARSLPAAVARPAFLYAPLNMCSAAAEGHAELPMGAAEAYWEADLARPRGTAASIQSGGRSGTWSAASAAARAAAGSSGGGMVFGDEESRPGTAAIAGWFPWLQRQSVTVGAPWGQEGLSRGRGGINDDENEVMKRVQSFLSLKPPAGSTSGAVGGSTVPAVPLKSMPLPEVPMPGLDSPARGRTPGAHSYEADELLGVSPALLPTIRDMSAAGHVNATRLAEALDCADRISMGMAALAQAEAACVQMLLAYARAGGHLTLALCKSAPGLWLLQRCGVASGPPQPKVWGESPSAATAGDVMTELCCDELELRIAGAFLLDCQNTTQEALGRDPLAARSVAEAAPAGSEAASTAGDASKAAAKPNTHASIMRRQALLAQRCTAVLLPRLQSRQVGTARAASETLATLAGCGEHARAVLLMDRCVPALASLTGGLGDGVDGTVRQHAASALQRMSASGSMQRQQGGDTDDIVASVLLLLPDPLEDQHTADGDAGEAIGAGSERDLSAGAAGGAGEGRRVVPSSQLANVAEESGADSDGDSVDAADAAALASGKSSSSSKQDEFEQVDTTPVTEAGGGVDSESTSSGDLDTRPPQLEAAPSVAAKTAPQKPATPQQRERGMTPSAAVQAAPVAAGGPTLQSWANSSRDMTPESAGSAQAIRAVAGSDTFMSRADRLLVASFALAEFAVAATTQLPASVVALALWSPLPSPPAYLLGVESVALESATGAYIPLLSSASEQGLVPRDTLSAMLPPPSRAWAQALGGLRVGAWMKHSWSKILALQTTEGSTGSGGAPFSVNLFGELVAARASLAADPGAALRTELWGEEDGAEAAHGSFAGLFDSSLEEHSVGFASESGMLDSLLSGPHGNEDVAAALAGQGDPTRGSAVPNGLSRARLFLPPGEDPMASPLLGLNPPPAPEAEGGDPSNPAPPALAGLASRQRDLSQAFNSLPAALRPSYAPVVMLGQAGRPGEPQGSNAREALTQAATYMRAALADDAAAHPHWRAYTLPGQDLTHATPEEVATAASVAAQRTVGSEVVRRASNRLGLGSLLHNQARQMPTETGTHAAAVDFAAAREEGSPRPGEGADMLLMLGSSALGGSIATGLRTASASGARSGVSSAGGTGGTPSTSSAAKRTAHAGDTAVFTLGGEVGVRTAVVASDDGVAAEAPKPWWERHHAAKPKHAGVAAAGGVKAETGGGTAKAPLPALSPRGSARSRDEGVAAEAAAGPDVYARLAQDSKMRAGSSSKSGGAAASPALRKSAPLKPIQRAPKPVVVRSKPKPTPAAAAAARAHTSAPSPSGSPDAAERRGAPKGRGGSSLLGRMEANALATRGNTTRRVVAGGTALKAYSSVPDIKQSKVRGALPLPSPVQTKRRGTGGVKKGSKGKHGSSTGASKVARAPKAGARAGTCDPSPRAEALGDTAPQAPLPARKTVSAKASTAPTTAEAAAQEAGRVQDAASEAQHPPAAKTAQPSMSQQPPQQLADSTTEGKQTEQKEVDGGAAAHVRVPSTSHQQ